MPKKSASGEVPDEASQPSPPHSIPCPPAILLNDVSVNQGLNALPKSSNVADTPTEPNHDVTAGQNLELILDSYDGMNTGVDTAVASSDHDLAAMRLFDKISNSFTETLAKPTPPNTATNEGHSLHDQRQDVESQSLNRSTPSVLQRGTAARRNSSTLSETLVGESEIPSEEPEIPLEELEIPPEEPEIEPDIEPDIPLEESEIPAEELNIPPEELGIGAHLEPNDEFNTALVPLSEAVPCEYSRYD
ncbi:uncharacterized protein N0V89_005706 [Didymosphaeria variabile]|uniref:Uncharacterized protein n=1 Tax=Didymosphaeria variabile TaxID=1932322 RepID=A0A9W8XLY5_9PLEO|nr:uncharacterized protein N0V89_005706 [Didymosphaeria variabile]KAJ4353974.1 hypothetical protein N0V89_005706 [Didymosphaeria variabile]